MSRLRDEKGRFLKKTQKTKVTGASLPKGFISTVGSFKMSEEETSKGPTAEQRREYERMLEIENKRRQERRDKRGDMREKKKGDMKEKKKGDMREMKRQEKIRKLPSNFLFWTLALSYGKM